MAIPSTNQAWLEHWQTVLYKVSMTGQDYSIPGAQSVKNMSAKDIQEQIDIYEAKVLEETYGYNGRVEVR